jgi:hypothetical protein
MAASQCVAFFVAINVIYPTYFSKKLLFLLLVFFISIMASMEGIPSVRKEHKVIHSLSKQIVYSVCVYIMSCIILTSSAGMQQETLPQHIHYSSPYTLVQVGKF